jgi:hypothetical protein
MIGQPVVSKVDNRAASKAGREANRQANEAVKATRAVSSNRPLKVVLSTPGLTIGVRKSPS